MTDAPPGAGGPQPVANHSSTGSIVVTGATGYLGSPLVVQLHRRGHGVKAFVRPGSEVRLPPGVPFAIGDPFSADDVARVLERGGTLVHLIGTPHPNPSKAQQFRDVDLRSAQVAADAATRRHVAHIVYVSVAHPAPVMRAYIQARSEAEASLRATGIPLTVLRPWYVLGPGHWWPYALVPVYKFFEILPPTRETARRLGLVTHEQMIAALVRAIEGGPHGVDIVEVPEIRRPGSGNADLGGAWNGTETNAEGRGGHRNGAR
jgi:uncharacterized protein YbjT (DUF2867 family)